MTHGVDPDAPRLWDSSNQSRWDGHGIARLATTPQIGQPPPPGTAEAGHSATFFATRINFKRRPLIAIGCDLQQILLEKRRN